MLFCTTSKMERHAIILFFCEGNDFCPIPVYFYRNGSCYFGRVQTEVLSTRIDILLSDDCTVLTMTDRLLT